MHPGSTEDAFPAEFRTLGGNPVLGSAKGTRSVSIIADICGAPVPNRDERRQNKQTGLSGAPFSCPPASNHTDFFLHWNQPVAPGVEDRLPQLKTMVVRPEEDGPGVATLHLLCASLFYGVFSGIPSDSRRRLMVKTEV